MLLLLRPLSTPPNRTPAIPTTLPEKGNNIADPDNFKAEPKQSITEFISGCETCDRVFRFDFILFSSEGRCVDYACNLLGGERTRL